MFLFTSDFSAERETAKPMRNLQFPQWFGCNCETELNFLFFVLIYFSGIVNHSVTRN